MLREIVLDDGEVEHIRSKIKFTESSIIRKLGKKKDVPVNFLKMM